MVLTGARELIGWERNPHSVHIPLRRQAIEGPLGLPAAAGDRQATEYLFSVALLRPQQTAFLLNLAPKLLGLELVWLLKEK